MLDPGAPAHQPPAAELMARSKISSLSWDPGAEHRVAASDYDGAMSLWDVESMALVHEFEAHVRRVWAVHYCAATQGLLATGSDDGLVKLWSTSLATMVGQVRGKGRVRGLPQGLEVGRAACAAGEGKTGQAEVCTSSTCS